MINKIKCSFCQKEIEGRIYKNCKNHFCDRKCYISFFNKDIKLKCSFCGNLFLKRKKIYNQISKKRDVFFCSSSCSSNYNYKEYVKSCPDGVYFSKVLKILNCENCGKKISKKPYQLNKEKFSFCNKECRIIYYEKYGYKGKNNGFNNSFFDGEIKTEEQAYVLGVIYSDGTISSGANKHMRLEVNKKDEKWLIKIAKIFGKEKYISYRSRITSVNHIKSEMCYFTLFGNKIWMDLYNKGILPRKSKIDDDSILKYIPKNLFHHFIRGIFDGDGSICDKKPSFIITNKKSILENIQIVLCKELLIKHKNLYLANGNTYDLAIGGKNQVVLIREWLYKDATIFLQRKKDKFYNVINKKNTSKYRGVYKHRGKWDTVCHKKWIGSYNNEIEAAKAYDKELIKYNPPLYLLNFNELVYGDTTGKKYENYFNK